MFLGRIRSSVSRLTGREQTMLAGLLISILACIGLVLVVFILDGFGTVETRTTEMHDALRAITTGREAYLERKRQSTSRRARQPAAPALQSYLEQAAQDVGISIPESNERPPAPRGKRHVERAVDFKLRNVNLDELARFLHRVENGPFLVVTSQLSVRPRYRNAEQLDAQITVSTFDRSEGDASKKGSDRAGSKSKKAGQP